MEQDFFDEALPEGAPQGAGMEAVANIPDKDEPADQIQPFLQVQASPATQKLLSEFLDRVHEQRNKMTELHAKFEAIDQAYALYKRTGYGGESPAGCATDKSDLDKIVPPLTISAVDSMVAYLADVFLSGHPLFPVVSTPKNRKIAEQLEVLVDDHATVAGYVRQIALFLRDATKYNIAALFPSWEEVSNYSIIMDELTLEGTPKLGTDDTGLTTLKRIDPYNLIMDLNVLPADIPTDGDYAGYAERMSYTRVKTLLNKLSDAKQAINVGDALKTTAPTTHLFYREHPQVSNYVESSPLRRGTNYDSYFNVHAETEKPRGDAYEVVTIFARLIPKDYRINVPKPKHPQIFKLVYVNSVIVSITRVYSAYNILPILIGQPFEDGLGYQTQSLAEANIRFQEAAGKMFSIRFNAARRSVSDRAIYDSDAVSSRDVNNPAPAAKIPLLSKSILGSKSIRDVYYQIPYDPRGTETTIQDAITISKFSNELFGLNPVAQGQFQPGNKSVVEFERTMAGTEQKLRLPAMILEHQVFVPLKNIIKLNIYQYGQNAHLVSQKNGQEIDVDINELRQHSLAFKLAGGVNPKNQLAATEDLEMIMHIIAQSPIAQQAYGHKMPQIISHLAQLRGIKGFEEYEPSEEEMMAMQARMQQQQEGEPTDV